MRTLIFLLFVSANVLAMEPPTIWDSPQGYLSKIPIGASQESVFADIGSPSDQQHLMGKEMWVYEVGEGYGLRKFTFIFKEGVLEDVKYSDQGPYNGITAKQIQSGKGTE